MTVTALTPVYALFDQYFGGEPAVVASAAGRVNLIGEHTDYNGGAVLPIAIQQRTYVAARPREGTRTQVISAGRVERGSFDAASPERSDAWWDYVAGVALELRLAGQRAIASDIAIWSAIPTGAGLSSSAALEIAASRALLELGNAQMSNESVARTAWRAEVEFVGVPCGIMDQFASALAREGEALHLRCDSAESSHVPMADPVLIFDTGVSRALRASAYAERHAECAEALTILRRAYPDLAGLALATPEMLEAASLPAPLDRRARHVVTENARVRAVVDALEHGMPMPGALLSASHRSLRDDFECSSVELDWFVDHVMRFPGVRGARLTGAGWGGCAIAVGEEDALRAASPQLLTEYSQRFARGGRSWVTRAAGGPSVE